MMTSSDIINCVDEIFDEAVKMRRFLHENPELGNQEYKTTEYIKNCLNEYGIEVLSPLETGAVGILSCGNGKTVALRADIDALPIKEETGLGFSSKNIGLMHACGHDMHTAALLAAAKILSQHKDELHGTVKFIFQPDEEGFGGAQRLIKAGVFESPKVDKVFGIHIRPEIKSGVVAVKYGKSYAASDIFTITVNGKSSHGAEPHNGMNALIAAANIAACLDGIVSRTVAPTDSAAVSVCTFESGTACNIIPEKAVLTGIIRTLGKNTRKKMKQAFLSCVMSTAAAYGCTADIEIRESYPGVVNNNREASFCESCARELFPEVCVLDEPTLTTEDFGYYLDKADGCFYHVGAGSEYPLHNSKMSPDENCLKTMISMHVKTVCDLLK